MIQGDKWKLGNLSCVSSEKPDQKYQTLGPFISESFSISQKMCQITILSTIHLKKELRIVIWHIFWRRDGVKVKKKSEIMPPLENFSRQLKRQVKSFQKVPFVYILIK